MVLHAWWGLNDTFKAACTRLAEAGFVAFAPDLYHGKVATTIQDAKGLARLLDEVRGKADIAEAVAFLKERATGGGAFAVIGFSLGASYALDLAATDPEGILAVVIFYGTGAGDFGQSKAEYLGHFAETDEFESDADVDALEGALRAAGRPVTFYRYKGTGHWFFERDREGAYNQDAATLAWERTLSFLRKTLPAEKSQTATA
jgi:carboxymethylenebutenolidase